VLKGTGLLVSLAGLLLAGCSTLTNPLAPSDSAAPARTLRARTLSPAAFTPITINPARGKRPLPKPLVATQHITAATGGALDLSGAIPTGGSFAYSLSFPAGALSEDTDSSISVPDDNEAVVELLPHGVRFNAPVHFEVRVDVTANPNLEGIDQSTLDAYWYNNLMGLWVGQEAQVQREGSLITASVGLGHFSRYALGGDKNKKKSKGHK